MNRDSQGCGMWGILLACTVSGFISGQIVAQDFRSILSSSGWGIQTGPGIVFGILFSIATASAYLWNKDREVSKLIGFILLFTITSTAIYSIAVQIAIRITLLKNSSAAGMVAGGLAGLFGAGTLSLAAKLLSRVRVNFRNEILTTIIGTIAGSVFFLGSGDTPEGLSWSLHFIIWQIAVGWSLSRSIQRGMNVPTNLFENTHQSQNGKIS